jgi:subtilisin family serine protease
MPTEATNQHIMSLRAPIVLGGALFALAACSEGPTQSPQAQLGAVPPLLATHALGGAPGEIIPGAYVVQLSPTVQDVPSLARQLAATHRGVLKFTYTTALRGFAVERLPDAAVAALRKNPNVELVEADRVVRADGMQSPTPSWGLDRIDQATNTFNSTYNFANEGLGVTTYILDTGIRFDHVDFQMSPSDTRTRTRFGYDAIGDGKQGNDCHGHGTHVAGTVGGWKYGVAKQVNLVALRVLDCNGSGSTSGIISAIDWMVTDHPTGVAAVANMSLGGGVSQSLNDAVQRAVTDGIVVSVSAGNSNADACSYSPASATSAITVGATGMADSKATFSNYGVCVDLFAPGVSIVSDHNASSSAIATYSGTSMSSPHVAGASALYLVSHPGSTPAQVRDGLVGLATQGVVTSALSANNHLLSVSGLPATSAPPPPAGNLAPTAAFGVSCSGLTCSFTDKSADADGSISARAWTFGNGASSIAATPSVTFANGGSYAVTLLVTDDDGATATAAQTVSVTAPAPTPPANLALSGTTRTKGSNRVDLSWSGATATSIDVYRNGVRVTTVANTGSYSDGVGKKRGTYTHQVCHAGTTTCSNTISSTF